jgi:glucose/arabinose dehydrogenase
MLAHVFAAAALVLPGSQAQQELSVKPFAHGLTGLTAIASTPAEPRRLYAVEQVGRIRYFVNGKLGGTFLDIRDRVLSGGEQGLLSVAFHPGYGSNHRFYVNYTDKSGNTRVVEFRSRNGRGVKSTARQLLFVRQPYANHNGGELEFDSNGLLYVGMGDGGSAGDPGNRAQNTNERLAIPGASHSTVLTATSTSVTSVRTSGKRSTTGRAPRSHPSRTTGGMSSRAARAIRTPHSDRASSSRRSTFTAMTAGTAP